MNKMYIKGPRQQRAVKALLSGFVTVKNLGALIGAMNPRQIIFELRNQGFKDIILTQRFDIIDRDGRRCRPGEYFIPEDAKLLASSALDSYINQIPEEHHDVENSHATNDNREAE